MEMTLTDKDIDTVGHVAAYLALQQQIADLVEQSNEAKAAIRTNLLLTDPPPEPGRAWQFPGVGKVELVRGRNSEKLDRARLARAGVSVEVLEAATVKSVGEPHIRITGDEGGEDE